MRNRRDRLFIYLKQLILNVSTHRAAHKARPCDIKRGCTRLADMLPSKYEDNALQIKEKIQKELLRFFVLEVTARSAADIVGIHPNSAVLFYRKIRMAISHHLALAADAEERLPWLRCGRKGGCLRHSETQRTGLYRCRR